MMLNDISILLYAAHVMNEPIFIWVEDAAFYFNQFGYASESLWQSNLVVSAQMEDLAKDGSRFLPGQLIFVSEKRLGFGSYASSNIAQRFSNALTERSNLSVFSQKLAYQHILCQNSGTG